MNTKMLAIDLRLVNKITEVLVNETAPIDIGIYSIVFLAAQAAQKGIGLNEDEFLLICKSLYDITNPNSNIGLVQASSLEEAMQIQKAKDGGVN